MDYREISILVCSYNTPLHVITMLKSFVAIHGEGTFNIIIMENSTNDDTRKLLDENNIPYIKNPGGTHSKSIDEMILTCNTKYALLVDSDIIFTQKIDKLLDVMQKNNGTLMGEICGDRGGYRLHSRIQPWFCLINVDNIKKSRIRFHDEDRINKSGSHYFYQAVPLNPNVNNPIPFYDVGATFYEDIDKQKLNIIDAKGIIKYYKHFEGSSWQRASEHPEYIDHGNKVYIQFCIEAEKYKAVNIKEKFIDGRNIEIENIKVLLIQPIFCPTQEFLEINKKSILSILNYFKNNIFRNIKLVFGGYCKTNQFWKEIEETINNNKPAYCPVIIHRADKNYGKAHIVNTMFKECHTDEKYLFTMDSDIIFDPTEFNMLRRLITTITTANKNSGKTLGMLALNQKVECCHWHNMMDVKTVINGEILQRSSQNVGIAGGCLFITINAFKKVNGYRVMGIYAGDDGFLLHDLIVNDYPVFVITTIGVIHNFNEKVYNGNYQRWKESNLKKCLDVMGKPLSDQELIVATKDVENKWNTGFKDV